MVDESICLYYQTGFCKFRENCRSRHLHTICKEQHDFKAVGCSLRHPKLCKLYKSDGICKFKHDCAYNHPSKNDNKSMTEHDQEVTTLRLEVAQMKAKICQLENNVDILQKEIQKVTQINVEEIVAIVLSTQQSKNEQEKEALEDKEESVKCDICNFKARGKWTMIKHMSNEHKKCISCDKCGTYFGTRRSLALHNGKEHKINTPDEGSSDEANETHACKQCPQTFKIFDELQWHMEESHETKVLKKKKKKISK